MLSGLLGRFWGYVAAIGAFAVVAALWTLKAFTAGRRKEQAKQKDKVIEDVLEKDKLRRKLGKPDARKRLRDKHYRD